MVYATGWAPAAEVHVDEGLPLACFEKATFEQDGIEFFVCNGGLGLGGAEEMRLPSRFQPASKADWKKYGSYLDK